MHELVNANQGSTLIAGAKSLFHPHTLLVLGIGALFSFLTYRSKVSLQDTAFVASVTVLVFLLPAAGIVGPYLLAETSDALKIIGEQPDDAARSDAQSNVGASVRQILRAAKPLQRGFAYTTLAVILSSVALAETNQNIRGVDVDRVISAVSIALLFGTALAVFPMTWRLLQLEQVKSLYDLVLAPGRGPAATVVSGSGTGQRTGECPNDAKAGHESHTAGLNGPATASSGEQWTVALTLTRPRSLHDQATT